MSNDRDIFLVSVFTFITVLTWIFFEWVKTAKTSTVSPQISKILSPINPKIDTFIIADLEKRQVY